RPTPPGSPPPGPRWTPPSDPGPAPTIPARTTRRHGVDVGRVGIWSGHFRLGRSASEAELRDAAAELEALGYPSLWIPGGAGGPVVDDVARVLDATRTLVVATGILNIWMHEPADVAADHARLQERSGG